MPAGADSQNLDIDLEEMVQDVSASMRKARAGFALVIDEMQDLEADLLGALLSVQHVAGQRGWPFYIVGGGLPSLPGDSVKADPMPNGSSTTAWSASLIPHRPPKRSPSPSDVWASTEGPGTRYRSGSGRRLRLFPPGIRARPMGNSLRKRNHRWRRSPRCRGRHGRPGPRVLRRPLATGNPRRTQLPAGDEPSR